MTKRIRQVIFVLVCAASAIPTIFVGAGVVSFWRLAPGDWVVAMVLIGTYILLVGLAAIILKPWKD